MKQRYVVVEGFAATKPGAINVREGAWEFALDQRAFGQRRLLVAFAEADGSLRTLAHTQRTDPPEDALEPCIHHLGAGAVAAVAWCDETVRDGPPPADLGARFQRARDIAARHGIRLVDWIACDDQMFRSAHLALHPDEPWWTM